MKPLWLSVMTVFFVSACSTILTENHRPALEGTVWKLHAIHSMDDAQGTTRPDSDNTFTMKLDHDGQAIFRLGCNRGIGSWQATSASDGVSGKLEFGPIAATRALCPPPHLDERVVRDLAHVRGYLLKDGNLHMSLMADAAIYEWHPDKE